MSETEHNSENHTSSADDSCFREFLQKVGLKSGGASISTNARSSRRKYRVTFPALAASLLSALALCLLPGPYLAQAAASDELGDHLPFFADDNHVDNDNQIDQADELEEALKMVTSNNAELLMLIGPRHPYQEGPLGVIRKGAYADMILVDGNPPENLDLVANAEKNFVVIIKDDRIYKNTLE